MVACFLDGLAGVPRSQRGLMRCGSGRVARGGCSPRAPTDQDVRISSIRLVASGTCFAKAHRVDRSRRRERESLQEPIESFPEHQPFAALSRQAASPETDQAPAETGQRNRVARDPVVGEAAKKLLAQCGVPVRCVEMPMSSQARLQRPESTAEPVPQRPTLHHRVP